MTLMSRASQAHRSDRDAVSVDGCIGRGLLLRAASPLGRDGFRRRFD
jgi:hypothetical protein